MLTPYEFGRLVKTAISADLVTRAMNRGLERAQKGEITPERMGRFVQRVGTWSSNPAPLTHAVNSAMRNFPALSAMQVPTAAKPLSAPMGLGFMPPVKEIVGAKAYRLPQSIRQTVLTKTTKAPKVVDFPQDKSFQNLGAAFQAPAAYFVDPAAARPTPRIVGPKAHITKTPVLFHELGHHVDKFQPKAMADAVTQAANGDLFQQLADQPYHTMRDEYMGWRRGGQLYRDWLKRIGPQEATKQMTPREFLAARRVPLDSYKRQTLGPVVARQVFPERVMGPTGRIPNKRLRTLNESLGQFFNANSGVREQVNKNWMELATARSAKELQKMQDSGALDEAMRMIDTQMVTHAG